MPAIIILIRFQLARRRTIDSALPNADRTSIGLLPRARLGHRLLSHAASYFAMGPLYHSFEVFKVDTRSCDAQNQMSLLGGRGESLILKCYVQEEKEK